MKFFCFAASDSRTSLNKKVIERIAAYLREKNYEVDLAQFEEFSLPLYSATIQQDTGIPNTAEQFVHRMLKADKVIISSPEYNGSVPGTLKNLVDWVSRIKPMPWNGQDILLTSASPSLYGGVRGLLSLRQPLEVCGAHVFPKTFCLSNADSAFTDQGTFVDPKRQESLETVLEQFIQTRIVRNK